MKKNKTIAYMLAATLLVGGTFVGTKAWFTASGTVDSGLVVTTGTMGLSVTEDNNWKVVTPGGITEITNQDAGNNFENVKPGDIFEKTVTITNTGSLNQILTVSKADPTKTDDNFTVTVEGLDELNGKTLEAKNGEATFKIKVETNTTNMHSNDADTEANSSPIDGDKHDDEATTFDLKGVMGQITISAKQTNAN